MPPKVVAAQHGAQRCSNTIKFRNINDALRTKNKYKRIRSTVKRAKINRMIESQVVLPEQNINLNQTNNSTPVEVKSSLTLAELAALCKNKKTKITIDQVPGYDQTENNSIISFPSKITSNSQINT